MQKISIEEIKLKCPDRDLSYYPFWRLWMAKISFFWVYFIVNFLKIKNPTLLSISMIIFWVLGALLIFFDSYFLKILWGLIIIFSYFIDMMDWKLARLLSITNENNKWIWKFLDYIYHPLIIVIVFLWFWYNAFIETSNIYFLFLAYWIWVIHMFKMYLTNIFTIWQLNVLTDSKKEDFEKMNAKHYNQIKEWKIKSFIFQYFIRYFSDSTDLFITFLIVIIFWLYKYFLVFEFILYIFLLLLSIYHKINLIKNAK